MNTLPRDGPPDTGHFFCLAGRDHTRYSGRRSIRRRGTSLGNRRQQIENSYFLAAISYFLTDCAGGRFALSQGRRRGPLPGFPPASVRPPSVFPSPRKRGGMRTDGGPLPENRKQWLENRKQKIGISYFLTPICYFLIPNSYFLCFSCWQTRSPVCPGHPGFAGQPSPLGRTPLRPVINPPHGLPSPCLVTGTPANPRYGFYPPLVVFCPVRDGRVFFPEVLIMITFLWWLLCAYATVCTVILTISLCEITVHLFQLAKLRRTIK
jgi:hypothetical protein